MMKNQKPTQFDFSRNDKFYTLTIPRYSEYDQVILYQIHLKDLVNNKEYINFFRFKDLKEIHQNLTAMKVQNKILQLELPEFPKTHFWRKTNKSPQLISQRRVKLEYYFQIIVNDPFTRGYPEIKKLIKQLKLNTSKARRLSSPPFKSAIQTSTTRSHSLTRFSKEKPQTIQQLKKSLISPPKK